MFFSIKVDACSSRDSCSQGVAISLLGKLSGAHINPAVSLAFWVQGKMHHLDLVGYILGQVLGAIVGTLLVALARGGCVASVGNGATLPGAGYPLWMVFWRR